jgi:hypothetical protein
VRAARRPRRYESDRGRRARALTPSRVRFWGSAQADRAPQERSHLQLVEFLKRWGRWRRGGVRGIAGCGARLTSNCTRWARWPRQGRTRQQQGRLVKLQSRGRQLERGGSGLQTGRALAITMSSRAHSKSDRTRTARLRSHDNDNATLCRLLYAFARARVHRSAPLGQCMAPPMPPSISVRGV